MKNFCLLIIFLTFFIPLIQMNIQYFEEKELKGHFEIHKAPKSFDIEEWLSGDYQKQYEAYFNDSIGFKNSMVRLYNQFCFYTYKQANSKNTIIGKKNILFQEDVIKSYFGEDYIGEKKLDRMIANFSKAQELLKNEGVILMAVFAPSKASYFNQYLPDKYPIKKKKIDNYTYLSNQFKKLKLNHIDLVEFFKNKPGKHPIYPKNGMHWSGYSTTLSFDTIISFIEQKLNKNLRGYSLQSGVLKSDSLEFTDNDIADAMNMMNPPENFEMYYPKIKFEEGNFFRPNTLIIGDSYAQSFYGFYPFYDTIFSNESNLWYYNRIVLWPYQDKKEANVPNLDLKQEILSRDVIILMATEANLNDFGYGFIEECEYIIKGEISPREQEIMQIQESIIANKQKYNAVKRQAIERNETIEQRLRANAIYIYNQRKDL